jgi:hypothetical protein
MEHLPAILAAPDPVARIRQLREAALAEESGARLRALL